MEDKYEKEGECRINYLPALIFYRISLAASPGIFRERRKCVPPGNGDGLLGEYYSDMDLSTLVYTTIDQVIDLSRGGDAELHLLWGNPWIEQQIIPQSQLYSGAELTPSPTDPPSMLRGDMDCDGDIGITDALLIAQYYVNLINSFC
jgi:hypothetical protein